MTEKEMKESYPKLTHANVASVEGDVALGVIHVTYMNGYRHTFRDVGEVNDSVRAFWQSGQQAAVLGALFFSIAGLDL